jgi:hypothetical protein
LLEAVQFQAFFPLDDTSDPEQDTTSDSEDDTTDSKDEN